MKYPRVINSIFGTPWAITEDKMGEMIELIEARVAAGQFPPVVEAGTSEHPSAVRRDPMSYEIIGDGVVVVDLISIIQHREDLWSILGFTVSAMKLAKKMRRMAADPDIKTIVFDIDSPGGSVAGIEELAALIHAIGKQKHTVAVVNTMAASAAYWLASQCGEIIATPSGLVGSIGVVVAHTEYSRLLDEKGITVTYIHAGKHKVDGNATTELSDSARAELQALVDETYEVFVGAVARGRGISSAKVEADYGQGHVFTAKEAMRRGMVDRVDTMDAVLEMYAMPSRPKKHGNAVRSRCLEVLGMRHYTHD